MRTIPLAVALVACTGKDGGTDTGPTTEPTGVDLDRYEFDSRFGDGSSVAYSGQVMRQLLISDLSAHVGDLTGRLDAGFFPAQGDVEAELDFYFSFDSATSSSVPFLWTSDPAPLQSTYGEIASDKDLVGKIAGNDIPFGDLVGWADPAVTTPESLVRLWFAELDAAAVDWSNGTRALGPDGSPVPSVAVTADGRHLGELIEKFLKGAISYSQGTDDYLDDDVEGSGLLNDNAAAEDGELYTPLEHAWDEAFGYFGAARDYGTWSDDLLAGAAVQDSWEADGAIDLMSEVSWGHATNAGKRDLGAIAPTDFSGEAWNAFVEGRHLVATADGDLDAGALDDLKAFRDQAVGAWEAAIAATVVHYLNDTLKDMSAFGTADYDFEGHAEHWSEAKGFALSLQFNPRSRLSAGDLATLHARLGQAPVLPTASAAGIEAYREGLVEARGLLAAAYGFDPANVGDENGEHGW